MPRKTSERQQLLINGPHLLAGLLDEQAGLQQSIWDLGRDLVLAGMTYSALGRMLGTSSQAARQRFSRHVEAWRQDHGDVMPWDLEPDSWAAPSSAAADSAETALRLVSQARS